MNLNIFSSDEVFPAMDAPVSAVKLVPIALNANDYDLDEADSASPMLRRNEVAPAEEQSDEEKQPKMSVSLSPINDKLKDFVGGLAGDETGVEDDQSADVTLLQAAAEGEIGVVKKRVNDMKNMGKTVEAEINRVDDSEFTALHMAARYNRKNVVSFLIDNNANINKVGKEGLTPLHLAAK